MSAVKSHSLVMGSLRERTTVSVVAGLSGFYAAALLMGASILAALASGGAVAFVLRIVSSVFIAIAFYVSAVVMTNCVATVIAGRLPQIATLRLLGADSRRLRRDVARSCAVSAAWGGVLGIVVGTLAADVTRIVLVYRGTIPNRSYPSVDAMALLALLAVVAAAMAAGFIGSRKVLEVNPAAAMSGVLDVRAHRRSTVRATLSLLLIVGGLAMLGLAAYLGEQGSTAGFMTAFVGSAATGSGILLGAVHIVPRLVALLGLALGDDPAGRVARRNAVADPMRTTRSTVGLIIGVTLVTTFASGTQALSDSIGTWNMTPAEIQYSRQVMSMTSTVMICIVVISSVIAAVGFVSTMSLVVIQRRREIGLLRSLGFTARQVATMVTKEAVALGLTAVLFGIGLGVLFGSVGAQSLVGKVTNGFQLGLPLPILMLIVGCAVLLVLIAALPPVRRALAISPVEALRVES